MSNAIKNANERNKKARQKEILAAAREQERQRNEQIEKLKAEAEELRPLVKEKLWPYLKEKTIDRSSIICQIILGRINEKLQLQAAQTKLKDLGLDKIFVEGEEFQVYEIVKDLTVNQANKVLGGLEQAVQACVRREGKNRKMEELKELSDEFN